MLAFPLLELGRMADAEKAARKGLEINEEDPWVHHAVSKNSVAIHHACMLIIITFIGVLKMVFNNFSMSTSIKMPNDGKFTRIGLAGLLVS